MPKFKVTDESKSQQRGKLVWTIASAFDGKDVLTVTLILNNPASGNTFYDKHILRRGEDPSEILALRNAEKTGDGDKVNIASGMGIKASGAPASTVVVLDRIDFNKMIFCFAAGLVAAKNAGKFAAKNKNVDVEINFDAADSVVTVGKAGATARCQSMEVGAQLQADSGDELTFEINHCKGAGSD
jgi:hypothetical protein